MVAQLEVVAFAPEQRTFVTRTRAVLVGSCDKAVETDRLAVVVVFVVVVLVRDASVLSPSHGRVLARYRVLPLHLLLALSDLPRVIRSPQYGASGHACRCGGTGAA